jgi:serine/threonine protein kinase
LLIRRQKEAWLIGQKKQVSKPIPLFLSVQYLFSRFRHPHLITLIGHSPLNEPQPCLVFPLMPQGSLRDRLDCHEGTPPLSWDVRVKVALQTALALSFLHAPFEGSEHAVLHLDVKSDNVLLDDNYDAKVGQVA